VDRLNEALVEQVQTDWNGQPNTAFLSPSDGWPAFWRGRKDGRDRYLSPKRALHSDSSRVALISLPFPSRRKDGSLDRVLPDSCPMLFGLASPSVPVCLQVCMKSKKVRPFSSLSLLKSE